MKRKPTDVAASVRQRLLDLAKARGDDFNFVLTRYALERLLYRLGKSSHADQFVLKGAMLFSLWSGNPHRATRDMDLLGKGEPDLERLASIFQAIVSIADDDGIEFIPGSIKAGAIREQAVYDGIRVTLEARLAAARISVQVDVGFGDAVTPSPPVAFPTLLDMPAPMLRVYPREAVIAEKFHAMVDLGIANSRMKDFFDVWFLIGNFAFDPTSLGAAIKATFDRRKTALPASIPIAMTEAFASDQQKQRQWAAFIAKSAADAPALSAVVATIRVFLTPVVGWKEV